MAIIILIILALSAVHFVYEGIIGPSIRMRLRFHIFEQRDALRSLKISRAHAIDDQAFKLLHDSLNNAIRLLPIINISLLVQSSNAFSQDENLRKQIEKRDRILKSTGLKEVDEIRLEMAKAMRMALAANTAGLFLYLFPIIAAVACVQWTARIITEILLIPGREIDGILSLPHDDNKSAWCAQ